MLISSGTEMLNFLMVVEHPSPATLKMLGPYLDTCLIGHNFCNMLSILNELTLQKELQNFMINTL